MSGDDVAVLFAFLCTVVGFFCFAAGMAAARTSDSMRSMADSTQTLDAPGPAFVIEGKKKSSVNVRLVGVDYRVLPPKTMTAIAMGRKLSSAGSNAESIRVEIYKWLSGMFGKEDSKKVLARLEDPEDELDLPDVMELVRVMSERATGNPTS